jgi:hypothetical protein
LVATASADRTARVWDARTALPTTQPLRHAQAVEDVTFTADGTRLITGSPGRFTLWDVADGARLSEFVADGSVMLRVPIEDSTRLVLSAEDGRVAVWDIRAAAPAHRADLVDLAELIIGGRMRGPRDFVTDVPNRFARLAVWRRRAAAWANAPAGSFEEWVHWYFADPDTRPAQPGWRGAAAPR